MCVIAHKLHNVVQGCVREHAHACVHVSVQVWVCVHDVRTCACVCMCVHVCTYMCTLCACVCMCVHACVCTF